MGARPVVRVLAGIWMASGAARTGSPDAG